MVAADVLRHDLPVAHWNDGGNAILLGVRELPELKVEQVDGVVHVPLGELLDRLRELPRDREIHVICRSGQRAYYATRILLQNGFDAKIRSGGMMSYFHPSGNFGCVIVSADQNNSNGTWSVAWNGLSFDLKWIGYQANDMTFAAQIALKSYDPMFQFSNQAGFLISLANVTEAMGITQQELIDSADAPK